MSSEHESEPRLEPLELSIAQRIGLLDEQFNVDYGRAKWILKACRLTIGQLAKAMPFDQDRLKKAFEGKARPQHSTENRMIRALELPKWEAHFVNELDRRGPLPRTLVHYTYGFHLTRSEEEEEILARTEWELHDDWTCQQRHQILRETYPEAVHSGEVFSEPNGFLCALNCQQQDFSEHIHYRFHYPWVETDIISGRWFGLDYGKNIHQSKAILSSHDISDQEARLILAG